MTKGILIANRGEIACRIIRSCRALGLKSIAVHAADDERALHVQLADAAVALAGNSVPETYGNPAALVEAARLSGAEAVHPGYGFLAENAGFAEAVTGAGLIWIGPAARTIADMGDKAAARAIAEEAGVQIVPGSRRYEAGEMPDAAEIEAIGYPLLVKAVAGGGGMGMKVVEAAAELESAVGAVQAQARRFYGDGAVVIERFIRRARHLEVQVFGLGNGRAIHLFERECSIQRRFQKIVEETPAPGVSPAVRMAMCAAAVRLAEYCNYAGAGTVEFIFDADTEQFYFLEMNTRIQVEHPITEERTGQDIVALQIAQAFGEPVAVAKPGAVGDRGHAIEFRLCAENPARGFLPSPGKLTRLILPSGSEGLRIDTGVREGDVVSPKYDSLLAKIICTGASREAALERAREALARVEVEGVATNLELLRSIVVHPAFIRGEQTTRFIADHADSLGIGPVRLWSRTGRSGRR